MQDNKQSLHTAGRGSTQGYVFIALYVLLLYIVTIPFYLQYNNTVLPMGDPFTYTTAYFMKLDVVKDDPLAGFKAIFSADRFWLMNLMLFLFSPVLIKEPFSIALVNFVMFGLATASFYRLGLCLKLSEGFSFVLSWLVWLYPINYGFLTYESVPVLALDAMFMGVLNLAMANILVFSIEPRRFKNAIIAAVSVGLAVWGRGNSLPVLLMIIFCPILLLVFRACKEKGETRINFIVFCSVPVLMTIFFYKSMGQEILDYYQHHTQLFLRHHWNLADAMVWIKNVPGFFFWRYENSATTVMITWMAHLTVIMACYLSWKRNQDLVQEYKVPLRLLSTTGALIYFATYIINIVMFTDPLFTLYNCLLIYGPMRIGMMLSIMTILSYIVLSKGVHVKSWIMVPMTVFMVLYGGIATKVQTQEPTAGIPSPQEVEMFARNIDGLTGGGTVGMLWFRHYNAQILDYYRIKNNLSPTRYYLNKHYSQLWYPDRRKEEDRIKTREEIRKQFEEASVIVIGEYLDYYSLGNPYTLYQFRDEIPRFLNSPESPRLVVRMVLNDYKDERLLVLQRENEAHGQGEPLKLPYGFKPTPPPSDYGNAVIRYQFNMHSCTNHLLDKNIFFEKVGSYPHAVVRKCNVPTTVKTYSVGAGPKEHAAHIRMPTAWKFQGSNDKSQWSDLDEQSDQTDWVDDDVRVFAVTTSESYRFYRLLITAGVDPAIMRLYKFDLNPSYPTTIKTAKDDFSLPAKCRFDLFDQGNRETFFEKVGPYPHMLERKCNKPVHVNSYRVGAGPKIHAAHARMPVAWRFQGSLDRLSWVDLDIQSEQLGWKDDDVRTFSVSSPESYRYYRLHATAGVDPTIIRLYKFDVVFDGEN